MTTQLIRIPDSSNAAIPAFFEFMGIKDVTPKDSFSVDYAAGFITATVNRKEGSIEVARKHFKGGFTEASLYDPNLMDKKSRDAVINKMRADGFTQSEIARRIGFTQATVSNVLRKPKI